MAYVDVPGAWVENIARSREEFTGTSTPSTLLNATARVLDLTGETYEMVGHLNITGRATNVAFDTLSRIIWRTGTGLVVAGATPVTIGIQPVSLTAGPPAQGTGTYDVSATVALNTLADSTTYKTAMTTGTKTLSHGDVVSVRWTMGTRAGTDALFIQSFLNASSSAITNYGHTVPVLNLAATTSAPCPCVLDFEGDETVLGLVEMNYPHFQTISALQTYNLNDEFGMIVRPPVKCKVDGFWITARQADAINYELYFVTDPLGASPGLTLLKTLDGDSTAVASAHRAHVHYFPAVELLANTDYAFVVRSLGASGVFAHFATANDIRHIGHFYGFGVNDRRCTRTGATGAFTASANDQHFYGLHVCAWDNGAGAGGGLLAHPGMRGGFI